jgi:hypothetical protein
MGTALTTAKSTAVATTGDNPWLAAAADSNSFDGTFVKFNGNTGEYTKGQDGTEIPAGTRVAINMAGVHHGYICWVEGEVVDRATVLVEAPGGGISNKPDKNGLADHGPYEKHDDGTQDGWSEHHQIPMADEEGEKLMLQASSKSAVRNVKVFYLEYGKKRSQHVDDDGNFMIPVVELEVKTFVSKANPRAGKKYAPVLKIVDWVSPTALADIFDDDGTGEEDNPENYAASAQAAAPAEKKKRAPRAAKPDPEPEATGPAPAEAIGQAPVVEEAPPPAEKKHGFGTPAVDQTTKAAANAAAAAGAEGRRAKRF